MTEVETQYNLYDFNKINMARLPTLNHDQENTAKNVLSSFFHENSDARYFMMLCHENRDYTLFDRQNWNMRDVVGTILNDIVECIHNRGYGIIDIGTVPGAIEIWVKPYGQTEVAHLFMLFPYDNGVINY